MKEEQDLRWSEQWAGMYRDVRFLIKHFKIQGVDEFMDCWTFYIYVNPNSFPETVRESLLPKRYYTQFGTRMDVPRDNPLENLNWHCGMTWTSVEENGEVIKAGCDYQHYWDEGHTYTKEDVQADVVTCIDSLYEQFPEYVPERVLNERFRERFPGTESDHRWFDENGNPVEAI